MTRNPDDLNGELPARSFYAPLFSRHFTIMVTQEAVVIFYIILCAPYASGGGVPIRQESGQSDACQPNYPTDILCNNSTMDVRTFACVCFSSDLSLSEYDDCYSLANGELLPALRLTLTSTKSTGVLDSLFGQTVSLNGVKVPYEYYFKRRVANIISSYCSEESKPCIGMDSTIINPSNVVLLRLSCQEDSVIVEYTVLKSQRVRNISAISIIDPAVVLAALRPKLQRTLPYKIVDHKIHAIAHPPETDSHGKSNWVATFRNNSGFVIAVIVIAILMIMIFTIVIHKVMRDRWKRRDRTLIQSKEANAPAEKAAQYGALDDHLLASPTIREGADTNERDIFFSAIPEDDDVAANSTTEASKLHSVPNQKEQPIVQQQAEMIISCSKPTSAEDMKLSATTSLQFDRVKKRTTNLTDSPRLKKSTTVEHIRDEIRYQRSPSPPKLVPLIGSNDEIPITDVRLENGEDIADSSHAGGPEKRASIVVQVPVLIVPALKHRRSDESNPIMAHYEGHREHGGKAASSDDEKSYSNRSGIGQSAIVPPIRSVASEEYLLPKIAAGAEPQSPTSKQPDANASSDTGNSDGEANGHTVGFRLLLSGISYQPLAESTWSVDDQNNEECKEIAD